VTGGPFYTGSTFPVSYRGAYFYGDFVNNFISYVQVAGNGNVVTGPTTFATDADGPVDIKVAPDGSLYYLSIGAGELRRIQFSSGNQAPTAIASAAPTNGSSPLTVQFTGSMSSDPDGDSLTFLWDFGDGSEPGSVKAFGQTSIGPSTDEVLNNEKGANLHVLSESGTITKLSAYLDGQGSGVGNQRVRMAIYADSGGVPGALLLVTGEVTTVDGQAPGWVDFPVAGGGVSLPGGSYWIAAHQGTGAANTTRYYYQTLTNGILKYNYDSYAGGISNPFGTAKNASFLYSFNATYIPDLP
jgi:hypothetical protein